MENCYVQLYISAEGLADLDVLGRSDPYAVLYEKTTTGANIARVRKQSSFGFEVGRTEMIKNCLNPKFKTPIRIQFFFELKQPLTLALFDDDGHDDTNNDYCGKVLFDLAQVMSSPGQKKTFPLDRKGSVTITARPETQRNRRDLYAFRLSVSDLPSALCFSSSIQYRLSVLQPNETFRQLYKSELAALMNGEAGWAMSPSFTAQSLMPSGLEKAPLAIDISTHGFLGKKDRGQVICSVQQLQENSKNLTGMPLMLKGHPTNGLLRVEEVSEVKNKALQLADALGLGWQINLAVAIDFTSSNGDPRRPNSLHYYSEDAPNQYISAILSVGDVLMDYDSDKMVPVYGFGAIVPSSNGRVSHCFNVNLNNNPYVHDIHGILNAYKGALLQVRLSGPTHFSPVIQRVMTEARKAENNKVYTVLLIMTDGAIMDMDDTLASIVEADDAPLSIIIVGIGSPDSFESMDILDGDGVNLKCPVTGRSARRDLVQFVPYSKELLSEKGALAAELLREVPDQFERYCELRKFFHSPAFADDDAHYL